ncbi:hypothetical protein FIU88_00260 [Halomonas sp. THAF12]|uniref:DUF4437 domain-containing protein n=1 Tax=Halomonas sp. THAF12 TaxID=2587849 RepID=UPI001268E945|nr:DUF4437 domain-containing protein [Halomonas sp. THAF12]QFT83396.1 hypothetical protein FIU88_00260 [Halomonas sp. THAF12]
MPSLSSKTLAALLLSLSCSAAMAGPEITPRDQVQWSPLNAARGDQSPQAGALWGDRTTASGPAGFLVEFKDGFASPEHIHNITYRGVVISGEIHNDDPAAANQWLPGGSFWIQPAGESHITAASGEQNLAYIEIDNGPYLVQPSSEAFDNGERPVNVDESNLVWLDAGDIAWLPQEGASDVEQAPRVAYLWGETAPGQDNGRLIEMPAGVSGVLESEGDYLHAVVVKGSPRVGDGEEALAPGSYVGGDGEQRIELQGGAEAPAVLYVRTNGALTIR